MTTESIVLIIDHRGGFEVRHKDQNGFIDQVAWDYDLGKCLGMAAQRLGHELVIPISGPTTTI